MTCAKLLKASTEPTELPEAAAELIAATAGQLMFGELFGSRLAGVYAPPVLASFGTGRPGSMSASSRRTGPPATGRRSPYQPGYASTAGSVVTVEFAAPAPLGLLGNQ